MSDGRDASVANDTDELTDDGAEGGWEGRRRPQRCAAKPAIEDHAAWPMISRLPVMLAVTIPVRGFKVRDLLSLRVEQTVSSYVGGDEGRAAGGGEAAPVLG